MGFYPSSDPRLPPAVQKTLSSVFLIVVPGGPRIKTSKLFGPAPLNVLIERLKTAEILLPAERILYAFQVNECIRSKVKDCEIFRQISYGTAYISGDGSSIRTALHTMI